ncbi:SMC-Scp complex subunit ScpB [Verrucomicrobiota bacterium]
MSTIGTVPELKQILGALIFGAERPLTIKEMRKCLVEVAEIYKAETAAFAKVRDSDIESAINDLKTDLEKMHVGFILAHVAGGYKIQSDVSCGKWLKHFLNARSNRLSKPALETLAIIAYRQPISRAEIEAVRGVNVDYVIRKLMEIQLIKITGRSSLPGRPFLYGTTHVFFEHFGLKDISELNALEPALAMRLGNERKTTQYPEEGHESSNDEENAETNNEAEEQDNES